MVNVMIQPQCVLDILLLFYFGKDHAFGKISRSHMEWEMETEMEMHIWSMEWSIGEMENNINQSINQLQIQTFTVGFILHAR